jgi:hypothetical protein
MKTQFKVEQIEICVRLRLEFGIKDCKPKVEQDWTGFQSFATWLVFHIENYFFNVYTLPNQAIPKQCVPVSTVISLYIFAVQAGNVQAGNNL